MKEKIIKELYEILNDFGLANFGDIKTDAVLLGSGGIMDSLSAAQLIAGVERCFGVDIIEGDPDLSCLETIDALADYILQSERKML